MKDCRSSAVAVTCHMRRQRYDNMIEIKNRPVAVALTRRLGESDARMTSVIFYSL